MNFLINEEMADLLLASCGNCLISEARYILNKNNLRDSR